MARGSKRSSKGQAQRRSWGWWFWVLVGVVAVGVLLLAYRGLGPHRAPSAANSGKLSPIHEPALPGSGFTWKYQAYALHSQKPAQLVRGSKMTIVMLMASWCKYCAYEDRYVWPAVANTPGLQIDLVDVSSNTGIGNPGPKTPAFSGQDHRGSPVGGPGMLKVMKQYVTQFHLSQKNIHVYVDPAGMSYFGVQNFPTIFLFNSQGQLVQRINGALTISQAQSVVSQVAH